MTLLEFTAERHLGPPTSSNDNGESFWPCPKCGHSRFHTMPHKPPHKDRFKCWVCDFRGDIHDLLQHFFPREDYGRRHARIADLQEEFASLAFPSGDSSAGSPNRTIDPAGPIAIAWADLTGEETRLLRNLYARSVKDKFSLDELGKYDADFVAWGQESEQRHLVGCHDPDCEARVCRAARGLPPLTKDQLEARRLIREVNEFEADPLFTKHKNGQAKGEPCRRW